MSGHSSCAQLCNECTVPTFLQVYCWSTALRTPNTSHPLHYLFLGCQGFFLMFWVFSFLLFGVVCCRVPASLVLAFVSSPVVCLLLLCHLFLGRQSRLRLYHLVIYHCYNCPCKIATTSPGPPYLTKHACSNIPT